MNASGQPLGFDDGPGEWLQFQREFFAEPLQLFAAGGGGGFYEAELAAEDLESVVARRRSSLPGGCACEGPRWAAR